MSHNAFEDQTEQTVPSLLQSRPQRQGGWRKRRTLSVVLLLAGAVIIIGVGAVLAVVLASHGPAASSTNNTNSTITNKQVGSSCGSSAPPVYWNTLLQQTAQGLHLSVAQVKAQIKGGKSIQDVARAQGISVQQLQSIETSALQAANNQMVAIKCMSQAQANASVQDYVTKLKLIKRQGYGRAGFPRLAKTGPACRVIVSVPASSASAHHSPCATILKV